MSVSTRTLIERSSGRRVCSKCEGIYHLVGNPPRREGKCDLCGGTLYQREDDKEETVRKRLETYEVNTKPLIQYYKLRSKLRFVKGNSTINGTFREIEKILRSIMP